MLSSYQTHNKAENKLQDGKRRAAWTSYTATDMLIYSEPRLTIDDYQVMELARRNTSSSSISTTCAQKQKGQGAFGTHAARSGTL